MAKKTIARKSTVQASKTEFTMTDERKAELLGHATKSGVALKSSTVKAGGNYPIRFETKGTSILTRAIFAMATKPGQTEVEAGVFAASMESLTKDNKLLSKVPFPPEYNNMKTVVSRLRGEIRKGAIRAFKIDGEVADQVKDIASMRKLLA